jgi:Tfp pilus assembly protein PilF
MGIYESAINLLQEAIKKAPQNATYHYHLGVVYQKSEKVALAKSSFQRALQLDPKSKRADEIHQALADLNKSQ